MTHLYQCLNVPAMQNRLYSSIDAARSAPRAHVCLDLHTEQGYVFNSRFDPNMVCYDACYQNNQSLSPEFTQHLQYAAQLIDGHHTKHQGPVVEIGCGQGDFVELLRHRGLDAIGYDNAYQGESPHIRRRFFSKASHEQGAVLVMRHVLEHVPDPFAFMDDIAEANGRQGKLYLEVPDLDWILKNRQFFDIFHEHVNYFRLSDFTGTLADAITFAEKSFNGQYLSLMIDLSKADFRFKRPFTPDTSLTSLKVPFEQLAAREREAYAALEQLPAIVVWGAGAKGVTFCAQYPPELRQRLLFAVDINPAKHDCFMPISAVQVLSPAQALRVMPDDATILVMNPNYLQEIKQQLSEQQHLICL